MIFSDHLEAIGDPIIPANAPFEGARFNAFKEYGRVGKAHGSLMVGQLSHPGRQCQARFQTSPVSASDVQIEGGGEAGPLRFAEPHPATEQEIGEIVNAFAHAAEFLARAGWDGVELHGAHGFLLAQFLSPKTNKRTDRYGGSLENRMRLILEITYEVRRRVPKDFIMGIKINSTEFQDVGFQPEEAAKLCQALERHTFDFVELSGGTYEQWHMTHIRESTKKREAFFLDFADIIVPGLTKTKVFVTGGLRTVSGMVRALDTVDGIGLSRPLCQEWHLCREILEGRVRGAIVPAIDPDDFWLFLMAGNRQMRLVGMGQEPAPLWEKVVADLQAGFTAWKENKSTPHELEAYQIDDAASVVPEVPT